MVKVELLNWFNTKPTHYFDVKNHIIKAELYQFMQPILLGHEHGFYYI